MESHTPNIHLPEFWSKEPIAWFHRIEAQFQSSNVHVSRAKFNYALAKLPSDSITTIVDLLNQITEQDEQPYERLKERLLAIFVPSKWARARQLIKHPPLGDQRPTALMAQMLSLLPPDEQPQTLFLTLFLDRMPQNIREHLATGTFDTACDMAQYADQLWDARPPDAAAIAALAQEHARNVSPAPRGRSQNRTYNRPPTPFRSPSRNNNNHNSLCSYHKTFGTKAINCQQPCSWTNTTSSPGFCFYHARFGTRAHKCETGCTWKPRQEN